MQLKAILQRVPDPRGKQGQDYKLWSILGLIILSLLCGRRGMKAAFVLGRSLTRRQKARLGFVRGKSPCHATLTETLTVIDAQALADVLGSLGLQPSGGAQHIAIDGKTMRASKDSNGRAEHVLWLLRRLADGARTRGLARQGAGNSRCTQFLERLDVKGKIVTGKQSFAEKSITYKMSSAATTLSFRSRTIRTPSGKISKRPSTTGFSPVHMG